MCFCILVVVACILVAVACILVAVACILVAVACILVAVACTQIVSFLRRIMSSSVACPALHHFSTSSLERNYFREIVNEQKMCFDFLCNFCLKHFSFLIELSEMLS